MTKTNPDGTQTIQIQGLSIPVRAPYAEGHTLTANEANALNGLRGENIRNNCAKMVKGVRGDTERELTADELTAIHAKIAEYDAGYEFSVRGPGKAPVDPVDREARKIAEAGIKALVKAKGVEVTKERLGELVTELLAKRPDIMEQARARVNEAKALSASVMGEVELA